MKVKKQRTYSKYTQEAAILLGQQIKLARKAKQWTEKDLADRAGISILSLRKIEKGDLKVALGFAFEVASLVGVQLFDAGPSRLSSDIDIMKDKIALLPKKIKLPKKEVVNDDF